jgi:glycosyltransferase involved in cell wall biosynthesis
MLRAEKGHLLMLDAVKALSERWPTLRYLIAGDGVERAAIEARVQTLGLQRQVLLTGNVMPVHTLYPLADIVVMPSLSEPLGMSQIEALSLAVPVVASRTGGIPETVLDGETGVLVEPGDVAAWAAALDAALTDPSRMREMAARGAVDVRRRFSVASNTQAVLDLLHNDSRKD